MIQTKTRQIFLIGDALKSLSKPHTLERYLLQIEKLTPRTALKKAFIEKLIQVNGKPASRTHLVFIGDEIKILTQSVYIRSSLSDSTLQPNPDLELQILSQTKDWICVFKPSGIHSHPLKPNEFNTALNGLIAIDLKCKGPFSQNPLEGGLVHRLDQGTSGVLLCAKNKQTYQKFRKEFETHSFKKIYLAWIHGNLQSAISVKIYLSHHPKNKSKMIAHLKKPNASFWETLTEIKPIKTFNGNTLCMIRIHTGVTHQIRVTLASLGHPIVGDSLYSSTKALKDLPMNLVQSETMKIFSMLEMKLNLQEFKLETNPNKLRDNSFLLHALFLQNSNISGDLQSGVIADPSFSFQRR